MRTPEGPESTSDGVAGLPDSERAAFREQLALQLERAGLVQDRTRVPADFRRFGATSLIDYLRCPKSFYWSMVRPLPRRTSMPARIGTEVHRWIEIQSRGQGSLLDLSIGPDLSAEERSGPGAPVAKLKEAFRVSRFASQRPLYTERQFLLALDPFVVGGRIDAIFGGPGGAWEIVDYKTGRVPDAPDELSGVQLDIYALAANQIWGKSGDEIALTYFYLNGGVEVSRPAGDLAAARDRVERALEGIAARRFEATPGSFCRWCDFLEFCEPGRRHLR